MLIFPEVMLRFINTTCVRKLLDKSDNKTATISSSLCHGRVSLCVCRYHAGEDGAKRQRLGQLLPEPERSGAQDRGHRHMVGNALLVSAARKV